jgi:hypothetical protein
MNRRRSKHARVVAIAIAWAGAFACRPPPPAPPPTHVAVGDPHFPIVPMHLTATDGARGAAARTDVELRQDGTLYIGDRLLGRIAGRRLLDSQGRELFVASESPAWVQLRGRRRRVQVAETGALLLDENERIYFDEQGRVVDDRPGRRPEWLDMRVEGGVRHDALGTGAMMVLFNMIRPRR